MDSNTQYWINENNVQSGPMSALELQNHPLTADAYVWRTGLPDWVKITELPEFGTLGITLGVTPMPPITPDAAPEAAAELPPITPDAAPEVAPEAAADPMPENAVGELPEPPAVPNTIEPQLPVIGGTQVAAMQQPQQPVQPQPQPNTHPQPAAAYPECPPTNMVWAALATILCCIPLGIIAIVYSNKVSKAYYAGDMERAEHYSEVSAWWCIGTIIGGIILSPFVSLIQMMLMN